MRQGADESEDVGRSDRGDRDRYDGLERDSRRCKDLQPLDEYYLWCDHRAQEEAALITETAHRDKLEAIDWCGGVVFVGVGIFEAAALAAAQSRQTRRNSRARWSIATWSRRCCAESPTRRRRRAAICAMGHKWMWNPALGGLPPEEFLAKRRSAAGGVREKLHGRYATSDADCGNADAGMGGEAGIEGGDSDSGGRV